MSQVVTLERPSEGAALITMTNPEILNFGSWDAIGQLADAMTEAREGGARVSVLASGVPGHWFEHAWLRDLRAMVTGKEMSGDPSGYFRALTELARADGYLDISPSTACFPKKLQTAQLPTRKVP